MTELASFIRTPPMAINRRWCSLNSDTKVFFLQLNGRNLGSVNPVRLSPSQIGSYLGSSPPAGMVTPGSLMQTKDSWGEVGLLLRERSNFSDLEFGPLIGTGSFGRVYKGMAGILCLYNMPLWNHFWITRPIWEETCLQLRYSLNLSRCTNYLSWPKCRSLRLIYTAVTCQFLWTMCFQSTANKCDSLLSFSVLLQMGCTQQCWAMRSVPHLTKWCVGLCWSRF